MSEYFYHKGLLEFRDIETAKKAFDLLTKSTYFEDLKGAVKIDGARIVVDSVNLISAPVSEFYRIEDILKELSKDLIKDVTIEAFLYNEGFFEMYLSPNKIEITKISDQDKYSKEKTYLEVLRQIEGGNDAKPLLDAFFLKLVETLKEGYSVNTPLGVFTTKEKELPARVGRNPQTGETIKIEGKKLKTIHYKDYLSNDLHKILNS